MMDLQKTGALIAQRRKERNLTQKELADQLHISDRTVSKWERGVGFPDLALLEPLADALELSVLELMHGELSRNTAPSAEDAARITIHSAGALVASRLKRAKGWLCSLAILLLLALATIFCLLLHPDKHFLISHEEITAAYATRQCPFVLITTEEYTLGEQLLSDPAIASLFGDDTILTVDADITAPYQEAVKLNGAVPKSFLVEVIGYNLYVTITDDNCQCILTYFDSGSVEKLCVAWNGEGEQIYALLNHDNAVFTAYNETRDIFAPWRAQ